MGKAKNALSQLIRFGRQAEALLSALSRPNYDGNLPTNLPVFITLKLKQLPFHPKTPHSNPHVK